MAQEVLCGTDCAWTMVCILDTAEVYMTAAWIACCTERMRRVVSEDSFDDLDATTVASESEVLDTDSIGGSTAETLSEPLSVNVVAWTSVGLRLGSLFNVMNNASPGTRPFADSSDPEDAFWIDVARATSPDGFSSDEDDFDVLKGGWSALGRRLVDEFRFCAEEDAAELVCVSDGSPR